MLRKILVILLVSTTVVKAQDGTGNWLMYFGTNSISPKWSIHSEAQHRNFELSPNTLEQLLLRTGVNHHFNSQTSALVGYANITGYDPRENNGLLSMEHRIWQQFLHTHRVGSWKFEHRLRTEQRFFEDNFATRYRYRWMGFYPINGNFGPEKSYLGIYNEAFVTPTSRWLDRNRLFGCYGYQIAENMHVQGGLLWQYVEGSEMWSGAGKLHLQIGLIYNTKWH